MNKLLKSTGLILRKFDLNEADRIVTVLTEDRGKIDCIAKGARRFKSRFNGRLELFNQIHLTGFQGKELVSLNEAELLSGFPETKDLEKHRALFYLAEITQRLIQINQQIDGVYALLIDALVCLRHETKTDSVLFGYLIKLLTLTGFLPPWNRCVRCGETPDLQKPVYLTAIDAHLTCADCAESADRIIRAAFVKWVSFAQRFPLPETLRVKAEKAESEALWQWLKNTLNNLFGKPLRSEAFLAGSWEAVGCSW